MYFIGLDLGGTNVKGLVIDSKGEVFKQHYIATQDSGNGSWQQNVLEMVEYLKQGLSHDIIAIGLSAPGLPNDRNSCIAFMPSRLAGIENFDWTDFLGYSTYVLNDAHAALMAEAAFGVAKGKKNVVLLTLGTGVGGGLLINGKLYQGLGQMAGHLGHTSINANDDEPNIVGMPGSLEYAVGNYSIKKRSFGRFESTWELVEAYKNGDHWATLVWLDSVRKLSIAIASLINALSPELVILAGGITLASEALFEPLYQFMDIFEWRAGGKHTPVVQAHFGDMAGAMGAAGFAVQKSGL